MNQALYLHALSMIKGLGRKRITQLLHVYKNPSGIWKSPSSEIEKYLKGKTLHSFLSSRKEIDLEEEKLKLNKSNIKLVSLFDDTYPGQLKELPDKPLLLYVKGDLVFDYNKSLSIVGTRKCSEYGKECAKLFASTLPDKSFCIISGLARGIDGIAHETALKNNIKTIAVLGSGLNYIYPLRHKKLATKILESGGALVSEYPPDTQPLPGLFPERNRIVAGLSKATLVIEAPEKSGSMITADLALGYNKDVLSIPGNIFSKNFTGNHKLISLGAKVITCTQDLLEEYEEDMQSTPLYVPKNTNEEKILSCLEIEGISSADIIAHKTSLSFTEMQKTLSLLEIQGIISRDKQGNIMLTTKHAPN